MIASPVVEARAKPYRRARRLRPKKRDVNALRAKNAENPFRHRGVGANPESDRRRGRVGRTSECTGADSHAHARVFRYVFERRCVHRMFGVYVLARMAVRTCTRTHAHVLSGGRRGVSCLRVRMRICFEPRLAAILGSSSGLCSGHLGVI